MTVPTPKPPDSTNGRITLAVLAVKLDYLIQQVTQICERSEKQDERIDKLERQAQAVQWIGGFAGAVLIAVAIAAIKQWLGL